MLKEIKENPDICNLSLHLFTANFKFGDKTEAPCFKNLITVKV